MRKTLTTLALTAALAGGGTAVATTVHAAPPASVPATQADTPRDQDESDKTGLWGLLGLIGLAGLIRRKEDSDASKR